jgi:probable metal-binding protein
MTESFHGHDLLELIGSREQPWPLAEFRVRAEAAFGAAPAFHNCHQGGFTLDGLLAFFAERGKVSLTADSIALGPVARCNH